MRIHVSACVYTSIHPPCPAPQLYSITTTTTTHLRSILPSRYVLVCLFEIYRAASILKTVAQVATDIPPGAFLSLMYIYICVYNGGFYGCID